MALNLMKYLIAPVVHQLAGDDTTWDRIAIAQYPRRMAMVEMNIREDFQELHAHKDAGMSSTIVMGTFPLEGDGASDPSAARQRRPLALRLGAGPVVIAQPSDLPAIGNPAWSDNWTDGSSFQGPVRLDLP